MEGGRVSESYDGPERRKPGRPAKAVPDETLHVRVSADLYDRIARLALRADKPVTVAARTMLEQQTTRMESMIERTGEQPV
jgi:hypothetical protein